MTTHTIHIALLPDSAHLTARDTSVMKLKTFTLGPTTHVTSQPAVVSALWHPLGVYGSCLVTVTVDAVVRVWEISPTDRWSFDRPTLAIDLKKLADGTCLDQDFGPSVGVRPGFSPDSFEMEVASACFGGRGSGGWSPMTLWVAMRAGDVYALCPLLPEKWSPPPTLIPSLSCSIVAKVAAIEDDPTASEKERLLSQQQLAWMADLDNQDPQVAEALPAETPADIYTRPRKPGRVPKLQGPFRFELRPDETDNDLHGLLTDIYAIGAKVDAEELMLGEDDVELDDADQEGLSIGIVCLLTSSGRVTICLDLDGVQAQWLPVTKSKMRRFDEAAEPPSLLTFQALDTLRSNEIYEMNWPLFSEDASSRYSFFTTSASSINFISLTPWVFRLESELHGDGEQGAEFRLDLLVKGQSSIRERIHTNGGADVSKLAPLAASVVLRDPDLGYFLLSSTSRGPVALIFEEPELEVGGLYRSPSQEFERDIKPMLLVEPRPVYQPPQVLEENSALPNLLERLRHSKYKRIVNEEVRLSPATLTMLTDAHKVLSEETHRIGTAAAELFRRCQRLQLEMREQVQKANEVAIRVEAAVGDHSEDAEGQGGNKGIELRLQIAKENQAVLNERIDRIRKKAAKSTNRELSDKEKYWIDEVELLESNVDPEKSQAHDERQQAAEPWKRFDDVKHLMDELVQQAREAAARKEDEEQKSAVKVPTFIRERKVKEIMGLIERETALVDATQSRLEKLSMA